MNGTPKQFFEFDAFRVDVEERRLLRNGQTITLTSKVFDILLVLIENPGRTINKNELMERIWEDTFVEEGNLNRHISTLRKLLGDDPRKQRFIKTIPKRGYRFTGDVKEITDTDEVIGVETVSRAHLVIREETRESFWTISRTAIAAAVLFGVGLMGAWAFSAGGVAKEQKSSRMSADPEAVDAYTKGRDLWRNRGAESLHQATLLLERAVEKDPDFALGHAALADAYAFDYADWKKAEGEAEAAIALDPTLGEPHASLGFVKMFWQWDLLAAETEMKLAVSNSPDYPTGHQWYAANLAAMGRFDAALAEIRKAVELDPSSVAIHADFCQMLHFGDRNEEALTQCQKTLQLDPGNLSAHEYLYDIYCSLGMNDEAVNKFFENRILNHVKMQPAHETELKRAYSEGGIDGFRRAEADYFTQNEPYYFPIAKIYARLGETEKSFAALFTSCERKEWNFIYIADPVFAQMRYDPRMLELTDKLHARSAR